MNADERHVQGVSDREYVVQTLREHLSVLEARFGVRHLSLFGSTARDKRRVGSDVDLLVDFGSAPTFRQFGNTRAHCSTSRTS